jgi:DNA-binding beta-propeller fold protein YncE
MAPDINNPGGVKNSPGEIRDGVVSDSTRFPGGFIDEQITEAGAAVQIVGQFLLNNASFSQSFDVNSQDSFPEGLALKPDGSQLYVVGRTNDNVYQYSLSTAFDVSTASFVRSFDVSPQDSGMLGLALKPDGSQLYVVGRSNANVYQYSLSTAFDISTASFVQSFDVSAQDTIPTELAFKPDGSQLYVTGLNTANVFQYSLSTVFDISTASFVRSFDVSPQDSLPGGLAFKPDGSQLYVVGNSNDTVYQYSLSTAFDVSTASFVRSLDVSPQDNTPTGLAFKPDGSQLYIVGRGNDNVYQYAVGFVGAELG